MTATPQQYMPPTPPPAPQAKNGLGTTSLVMGILSIVGAWIPFAGFGSYATSVIGIVTGIFGRKRAKQGVATNGSSAMGGLVMSLVGLLSVILATVVYSSLLYAVATSEPKAVPTTVPSKVAETKGAEPKTTQSEKLAGIGDPVTDGSFQFTVKKVRSGVSHVGNSIVGEKAQGQFIIVTVNVKNIGDESEYFFSDGVELIDDANKRYSADDEAGISVDADNWLEQINPGNTMKGKLVFDVPKSVDPSSIELAEVGSLGGGAIVSLR